MNQTNMHDSAPPVSGLVGLLDRAVKPLRPGPALDHAAQTSTSRTAPHPIDVPQGADLSLTRARAAFSRAEGDFTETGRCLIAQLARLRGLRQICDQRLTDANSRTPTELDCADLSIDALHRMCDAVFMIHDRPAPADHTPTDCATEQNRLAADLATRTAALDRLTAHLNAPLNALRVEVSTHAANLFDAQPDAMKGPLLRGLIVEARIDFAGLLLQGGLDQSLVTSLAGIDPDVTLALAADLS